MKTLAFLVLFINVTESCKVHITRSYIRRHRRPDKDRGGRQWQSSCVMRRACTVVSQLTPTRATMSSTINSGVDGRYCIDGNITTFCQTAIKRIERKAMPHGGGHGGVTPDRFRFVNLENQPWIALDFVTKVIVQKVVLINRQDAYGNRTRDVTVRVSDVKPIRDPKREDVEFKRGFLLGRWKKIGKNGENITIQEYQADGRYVIVQMGKPLPILNQSTSLNLAEVMVFGRHAPAGDRTNMVTLWQTRPTRCRKQRNLGLGNLGTLSGINASFEVEDTSQCRDKCLQDINCNIFSYNFAPRGSGNSEGGDCYTESSCPQEGNGHGKWTTGENITVQPIFNCKEENDISYQTRERGFNNVVSKWESIDLTKDGCAFLAKFSGNLGLSSSVRFWTFKKNMCWLKRVKREHVKEDGAISGNLHCAHSKLHFLACNIDVQKTTGGRTLARWEGLNIIQCKKLAFSFNLTEQIWWNYEKNGRICSVVEVNLNVGRLTENNTFAMTGRKHCGDKLVVQDADPVVEEVIIWTNGNIIDVPSFLKICDKYECCLTGSLQNPDFQNLKLLDIGYYAYLAREKLHHCAIQGNLDGDPDTVTLMYERLLPAPGWKVEKIEVKVNGKIFLCNQESKNGVGDNYVQLECGYHLELSYLSLTHNHKLSSKFQIPFDEFSTIFQRPHNCIDENPDTHCQTGTGNHHTKPWMAIDYGTVVTVKWVEITTNNTRARNVYIQVADEIPPSTLTTELFEDGYPLGNHQGYLKNSSDSTKVQTITIHYDHNYAQWPTGRYVIFQMDLSEDFRNNEDHIDLIEVKAFGRELGNGCQMFPDKNYVSLNKSDHGGGGVQKKQNVKSDQQCAHFALQRSETNNKDVFWTWSGHNLQCEMVFEKKYLRDQTSAQIGQYPDVGQNTMSGNHKCGIPVPGCEVTIGYYAGRIKRNITVNTIKECAWNAWNEMGDYWTFDAANRSSNCLIQETREEPKVHKEHKISGNKECGNALTVWSSVMLEWGEWDAWSRCKQRKTFSSIEGLPPSANERIVHCVRQRKCHEYSQGVKVTAYPKKCGNKDREKKICQGQGPVRQCTDEEHQIPT